jgi:hypothetical protein
MAFCFFNVKPKFTIRRLYIYIEKLKNYIRKKVLLDKVRHTMFWASAIVEKEIFTIDHERFFVIIMTARWRFVFSM